VRAGERKSLWALRYSIISAPYGMIIQKFNLSLIQH
jgi:hypothetical protein